MILETNLISKPSDGRAREPAHVRDNAPVARCDAGSGPTLDALAAALPAEYEGHWIAELVRSFGRARGRTDPAQVADYWQEALVTATKALRKTDGDTSAGFRKAFVKRAVRSRLTDLNRWGDRRAGVVTSAEDLPRDEEDDGAQRLIEERFADSAFDALPRQLASDVRIALYLLLPPERRLWRAFRETNGSSREMAAWLGISHMTVQRRLRPALLAAFERAYRLVRTMRQKAA